MKTSLQGKVAVVTGGSRGIGRGISLYLAEAGADVAVNYRKEAGAAEEVVTAIRNMGRRAMAFQADVGEFDRLKEMARRTKDEFGKIDILVANAGRTCQVATIVDMTLDNWEKVLHTNLSGVVYTIKAFVPYIRDKGGSVVLISSIEADAAIPEHAPYAVSKAGVSMLGRILAKEEAQYGIRVNIVAPGLIDTSMGGLLIKSLGDERAQHMLNSEILLKRMGQPSEMAALVAFLASDAASYITGGIFRADGGYIGG